MVKMIEPISTKVWRECKTSLFELVIGLSMKQRLYNPESYQPRGVDVTASMYGRGVDMSAAAFA